MTEIVEQFLPRSPTCDGRRQGAFMPQGRKRGRRKDGSDYVAKFRDAGYAVRQTRRRERGRERADKTLGGQSRQHGRRDSIAKYLKGGTVKKFPEQPDSGRSQPRSTVLRATARASFLMVEAGLLENTTTRSTWSARLRHHHARQTREACARLAAARGDDPLIWWGPTTIFHQPHRHTDEDMTETPKAPLRTYWR